MEAGLLLPEGQLHEGYCNGSEEARKSLSSERRQIKKAFKRTIYRKSICDQLEVCEYGGGGGGGGGEDGQGR